MNFEDIKTLRGREVTMPVSTRFPLRDYRRIVEIARAREVSAAQLLREAVREWLARQGQVVEQEAGNGR